MISLSRKNFSPEIANRKEISWAHPLIIGDKCNKGLSWVKALYNWKITVVKQGGDSSLILTRKRMRFFTPLALRSEWRLFRHPFFNFHLFKCHPEAKPKGLMWGFFAIAQNDKIRSSKWQSKTLTMTKWEVKTLSWAEALRLCEGSTKGNL